eukprot:TRINITY_DN4787_c0_g1_i1.p1 TRINITY_DN4787_c0_g1~~TRINITY_DN4787_c0_g1_i1.p1  ORF type:complete len:1186 (-),score=356.15 TRINITY_DN4787_c0_g1_i1:197-3691(-)
MSGNDDIYGPFGVDLRKKVPEQEQIAATLNVIKKFAIEAGVSEHVPTIAKISSVLEPVSFESVVHEKIPTSKILESDYKDLNKLMIAFVTLVGEIEQMDKKSRDICRKISIFGQTDMGGGRELAHGEKEIMVAQSLPFFKSVHQFGLRMNKLVLNLVHQLSALHSNKTPLYSMTFKSVDLKMLFRSLCLALQVLVRLDASINDNEFIKDSWEGYLRAVEYVAQDPRQYDSDEASIGSMVQKINKVYQHVINANMLNKCIEQEFDSVPLGGSSISSEVTSNKILFTALQKYLEQDLDIIMAVYDSDRELNERNRVVGLFGLFALLCKIQPSNGSMKRMYQKLWRLEFTITLLPLDAPTSWSPSAFLEKQLPVNMNGLQPAPKDIGKFQTKFAEGLLNKMPRKVASLRCRCAEWKLRFIKLTEGSISHTTLKTLAATVTEGVTLASQLSLLVKGAFSAAVHLSAMTRTLVESAHMCCVCLKSIQEQFRKNKMLLQFYMPIVIQDVLADLRETFISSARIKKSGFLQEADKQRLAAIQLCVDICEGSGVTTPIRRHALEMIIPVVCLMVDNRNKQKLMAKMNYIGDLCDWQNVIDTCCDCKFMFWNRDVFETLLKKIVDNAQTQASNLHILLQIISDCSCTLINPPHKSLEGQDSLFNSFKKHIHDMFDRLVIKRLTTAIDNDLRLHVHSASPHLKIQPKVANPFKGEAEAVPLAPLLRLPYLRLFDQAMSIKERVTQELQKHFYNMTAQSLSDARTYAEMTNLAMERFNLRLQDNRLPSGSLEHGIDVLQIMRHLNVFVRRFVYNINQQFFIEKKPDRGSKLLNVVSIDAVANSIRTHGVGIVNTTVDKAYRTLLVPEFHRFSEFMFDEFVRGKLGKELRFMKSERRASNTAVHYPYVRAEELTNNFESQFGLDANKNSLMDLFRMLITNVGNVLGYIRLVRGAAMQCCTESIKFMPADDSSLVAHLKISEEDMESFTPEVKIAAQNAVKAVELLHKNYASKAKDSENINGVIDFLHMLVTTVRGFLTREHKSRKYLRVFHMIVPALIINFTRRLKVYKNSLEKIKRNQESYFTDDGFAVGLAYVLAILEQDEAFDSLFWWQSVEEHIAKRIDEVSKAAANVKGDKAARQKAHADSQYKIKDLQQLRKEFQLLRFSFSSARIFFKI